MSIMGRAFILLFHGSSEEKDSTATALSASGGLHGASFRGSIQNNIAVYKVQQLHFLFIIYSMLGSFSRGASEKYSFNTLMVII